MGNEIKAGMTLYYRGSTEAIPVTVAEVKRKYFTIKEKPRDRFFVETLKKDYGQYSQSGLQLYFDKDTVNNEIESDNIYRRLTAVFKAWNYNQAKLSLKQLREIESIINNPQ
jgi:ribosomal protein S24E